jgi:hypothetical protein
MRQTIATACVLAMVSGVVWAQQPSPHTPPQQQTDVTSKKKASLKRNREAVSPAQEVPAQTMPPVPATLMNSAPVKPHVTMQSGLLTIDAPNSTLSDVLSGVRKATGASIEGASPSERVVARIGPGNPEQVIAALLRGTPYDYVILGSLGRKDVVTRVLLTQSSQSSSPSPSAPSGGQPPEQEPSGAEMHSPREVPQQQDEDIQQAPEAVAPQPTADGEADQAQQQPQQPQQPPAQQQDQNQNQPKTPEQLFKELQQLEQQKQQQTPPR